MKVIDLLNKIANGERFDNCKMKFKVIEPEMVNEYVIYDKLYEEDLTLNDEVEIIEEQDELIPKHITYEFIQGLDKYMTKQDIKHIAHKVNEIINYLQHKSKED